MSTRMEKIRKGQQNGTADAPTGTPAAGGRPAFGPGGGRGPGPGHGGPAGAMMGGEKARDFKGSLTKLTRFLRPYWFRIIMVMVFAAASTIFTIAGPKILMP